MSDPAAELLEVEESLPIEMRVEIVEGLLESMCPRRTDIDGLWKAEIELRIDRYESGDAKLVRGKEVFAKIQAKFGK